MWARYCTQVLPGGLGGVSVFVLPRQLCDVGDRCKLFAIRMSGSRGMLDASSTCRRDTHKDSQRRIRIHFVHYVQCVFVV